MPWQGLPPAEFFQVTDDAAKLLSWYLARAGGIPANHSFVRIVMVDDPANLHIQADQSPKSFDDFEMIRALVDYRILALDRREQEQAALAWVYEAVADAVRRWGLDQGPLDRAYRAADVRDPSLLGAAPKKRLATLTDLPGMTAEQFWRPIDVLQGVADEDSCAVPVDELRIAVRKKSMPSRSC